MLLSIKSSCKPSDSVVRWSLRALKIDPMTGDCSLWGCVLRLHVRTACESLRSSAFFVCMWGQLANRCVLRIFPCLKVPPRKKIFACGARERLGGDPPKPPRRESLRSALCFFLFVSSASFYLPFPSSRNLSILKVFFVFSSVKINFSSLKTCFSVFHFFVRLCT